MSKQNNSNPKKSLLIDAIVSGNVKKLQEANDVSSGRKVIIHSYYDHLKLFRTEGMKQKIASGEIEIEIAQGPYRNALTQIISDRKNKALTTSTNL